MKLTIQPPLQQWSLSPRTMERRALANLVNRNADRLGTGRLDPDRPILASGHQAFFWHPGILVKDMAAAVAARRLGGQALHVVVDQDVHPAMELDLPRVVEQRIVVERLKLGTQQADLPTGNHPPVPVEASHPGLPPAMTQALAPGPACQTLAEQVTVALSRLRVAYVPDMPVVFASQLSRLPPVQALVERMLAQASECVLAYNRAVADHPRAGIAALQWTRERIELPLWQLQPGRPRRRVFADLSDTVRRLVNDADETVEDFATLAPRALALTAIMRSDLCDLFVHGLGGGEYDRVMEAWWSVWHGGPLAPMAVATADLHLAFDAPLADRAELARALWYLHHLPHNMDRVLDGKGELAARKRELLEALVRDRDRARRRAAFDELHRTNRALVAAHPTLLTEAQRQVDRARLGLANAQIARRRDWAFALYPHESLMQLLGQVQASPERVP